MRSTKTIRAQSIVVQPQELAGSSSTHPAITAPKTRASADVSDIGSRGKHLTRLSQDGVRPLSDGKNLSGASSRH
jgi:hypothetical protein